MDRTNRRNNAHGKTGCLQVAASSATPSERSIACGPGGSFRPQLPMLIRGLYYDGWETSRVPIKMSREEFLEVVQSKIIADRVIDAAERVQNVFRVIASHVGDGELEKVMHTLPKDVQSLFPAIASAV